MHVPHDSASPKIGPGEPGEATLLAALAETSDALTVAIVAHDREAIVAATRDAERLVEQLSSLEGSLDPDAHRTQFDADLLLLAARIEATARRNALLLERAWATEAAVLRLLAAAAKAESDAASAGYGAGAAATATDTGQPAGWLDRSA